MKKRTFIFLTIVGFLFGTISCDNPIDETEEQEIINDKKDDPTLKKDPTLESKPSNRPLVTPSYTEPTFGTPLEETGTPIPPLDLNFPKEPTDNTPQQAVNQGGDVTIPFGDLKNIKQSDSPKGKNVIIGVEIGDIFLKNINFVYNFVGSESHEKIEHAFSNNLKKNTTVIARYPIPFLAGDYELYFEAIGKRSGKPVKSKTYTFSIESSATSPRLITTPYYTVITADDKKQIKLHNIAVDKDFKNYVVYLTELDGSGTGGLNPLTKRNYVQSSKYTIEKDQAPILIGFNDPNGTTLVSGAHKEDIPPNHYKLKIYIQTLKSAGLAYDPSITINVTVPKNLP